MVSQEPYLRPLDVVGTDGETTGRDVFGTADSDSHPDQLWEYAVVVPTESRDVERVWQIWPAVESSQFLSMSNFEERHHPQLEEWGLATMLPDGSWVPTTRAEMVKELSTLLAGKHIVGIIPGFDDMFLRPLLSEFSLLPPYHYHLICVESHVRGYIMGWHAALTAVAGTGATAARVPSPPLAVTAIPWDSEELLGAVGAPAPAGTARHSSLADARWALDAYRRTITDASRR